MGLNILAEDARLVAVDKPAGMAVPDVAEALVQEKPELRELGEERRYGIVHRLDKDTSGILLVAKTKEDFKFFQQQFQKRAVRKIYLCLVEGTAKEDTGILRGFLARSPNDRRKQRVSGEGTRDAVTEYRVVERFPGYVLLEVIPKTGRKHQIRAQFAHAGTPIAGDKLYGFKNQRVPEGLRRQFLHASSLTVPTKEGGQKQFHSPLPEELEEVLTTLRSQYANN